MGQDALGELGDSEDFACCCGIHGVVVYNVGMFGVMVLIIRGSLICGSLGRSAAVV